MMSLGRHDNRFESSTDDRRRRARDPLEINRDVHPILAALADREWTDAAACRGRQQLFFGRPGERPGPRRRRETQAKRVCAACPALEHCRSSARRNHENGLWGGETEVERALAGYPPRGIMRREVAVARVVGLKAVAERAEAAAQDQLTSSGIAANSST